MDAPNAGGYAQSRVGPGAPNPAVAGGLRSAVLALPCGEHYVCKCAEYRDDRGFLIRRSDVLALLGPEQEAGQR